MYTPPTIYKSASLAYTHDNSIRNFLILANLICEKYTVVWFKFGLYPLKKQYFLNEKTFIEIIQEYITYFPCFVVQLIFKLILLIFL